ncbi:hypothetical protein [uncultured Clostridium sp.]|uniref:hypothetical protein n=1 Tax=uncultured Clostridium sp. TaxID=59620 RepID=UPI0025D7BDC5|nr:hypothetical protein [uncultured Clostridium sp.]
MEAFYKLRVECPYTILRIEDIKVSYKPNEHGSLYLKAVVDESINIKYSIEASTNDKIYIYEEKKSGERSIIFYGLIQKVTTTCINGEYLLELEALTSSFELDIEKKSRSFQDTEMRYDNLISEILSYYKIYSFTECMDMPMEIGKSLFQYEETDYEFLKRVASEVGLELFPDIMNAANVFYFGMPRGKKYILDEKSNYRCYKDIKKYLKMLPYASNLHDTDYFYYEVDTRIVMEIGATVYFKNIELCVYSYEACYNHGELIYTYKLCRRNSKWQEKICNEKIKGISLEGEVLEVRGEEVKLKLDIDKNKNTGNSVWFRYAPVSGDVLYSMPIVGTRAKLYFQSNNTDKPIVTSCIRTNTNSKGLFKTYNRHFRTESSNNLDMLPGGIVFSRPGFSVNFSDESGISFSSSNSLSIGAAGGISINSGRVDIVGTSIVKISKSKGAYISLESEFYCEGSCTCEWGRDRQHYNKFTDDDPQSGAAEARAKLNAELEATMKAISAALIGCLAKMGSAAKIVSLMNASKPGSGLGLSVSKSTSKCSDLPVYNNAGQYIEGQRVKAKAIDGKWYEGTVKESGSIGTGGWRKFEFIPDNAVEYNSSNSFENSKVGEWIKENSGIDYTAEGKILDNGNGRSLSVFQKIHKGGDMFVTVIDSQTQKIQSKDLNIQYYDNIKIPFTKYSIGLKDGFSFGNDDISIARELSIKDNTTNDKYVIAPGIKLGVENCGVSLEVGKENKDGQSYGLKGEYGEDTKLIAATCAVLAVGVYAAPYLPTVVAEEGGAVFLEGVKCSIG